jgi:hypothetical protein
MRLAALARWHWMAIALVVGTLVGLVADATDSQFYGVDVQGYGMLLGDQERFESALIQDYDGVRLFSNPIVYSHWERQRGGQWKRTYIVCGQYWDGRERMKDGKVVAEWLPRCIITQAPYKPRLGIGEANSTILHEYPSVVEFLDALHGAYKVNYQYAWWTVHPVMMSMVGCLLVIGGIWPTLINLLAYGSLTRPPQVKAISLWNIRGSSSASRKSPYAARSPADEELDASAVSDQGPPPIPEANSDAAPVRTLSSAPLVIAPNHPGESRSYGADDEDFYPTERHAPGSKASH